MTITFDSTNWFIPVRIGIAAQKDGVEEEDQVVIVEFPCASSDDPAYLKAGGVCAVPNLRSEPGRLDVEVIDDDTAGLYAVESDGDTVVELGGANDDYTIRLTKRPVAVVHVSILTDGTTDVASINGVAVVVGDYNEVGIYRESPMFDGFIDLGVSGFVLTRGNGSDLGNFFLEGFLVGQLVRVRIGLTTIDALIAALSVKTMTLDTAVPLAAGSYTDVTIDRLTREGLYEGSVTVEIDGAARRIVLTGITGDMPGWLSHGFLEGQRIRVCDGGTCADLKIAIIRGTNDAKDTKIEFTVEGALPVAWINGYSFDAKVVRIAVRATFTDQNWYLPQVIEMTADTLYTVPSTRAGVKVFPSRRHVLSRLRGPLSVEGGPTGADRSLVNGVKLPGELDGPLFAIGDQPPESQAIDVLNIYDDARKGAGVGTMTSTGLTGFDMADDLILDPSATTTFGEQVVFPGGITWGQITVIDGQFSTDGGQSSIEVVNLMLGYQNDTLDVQGTLDPAPAVQSRNTFTFATSGVNLIVSYNDTWDWKSQGYRIGQTVTLSGYQGTWKITGFNGPNNRQMVLAPIGTPTVPLPGSHLVRIIAEDADIVVTGVTTVTPTGIGIDIRIAGLTTRAAVLAAGFLEGHLINIVGWEPTSWRLVTILPDGTLHLRGDGKYVLPSVEGQLPAYVQPASGSTLTVYVQGRHGGLTVVHGGGNRPIRLVGELITSGNTLTRIDGRNWSENGFQVGQYIQVGNETFTRQILLIGDWTCPLPLPGETGWVGCGTGATLVLSGPIGVSLAGQVEVHAAKPHIDTATGQMEIHTDHLIWTGGSWATAGFEVGQVVYISGIAGGFTVSAIAGSKLTLSGAALTPTISNPVGPTYYTVKLTVFGYDVKLDGGLLIGGDVLTVCDPTNPKPCGPVIAGPNSPLVLLGDTTQDGVWYSGHTYDVLGLEFGDKPFDPFVYLPDGDNEDDEWVFPLADPFDYFGNDVIDARNLIGATGVVLWSVGITAYGGPGNDTIYGSQTGDHLAGGSGDDVIHGERGADHIYGDSGVNIDILTRRLTITTSNAAPLPTIDRSTVRFVNNGTTIEPSPSPVLDTLEAGRDLIYGEGPDAVAGGPQTNYDDIICGDHCFISMAVQDPNKPFALPQRIQTTMINDVLGIFSVELQNGDDDTIFGNVGRDVIIAGAGHDMADGDEQDDLIFGDNVTALLRRIGNITSLRFQTLYGGEIYTRTDRPLPAGYTGPVNADNSGVLLTNGVARDFRDPDAAPWWAEYTVDYASLHNFAIEDGVHSAGTFGNDYLAGGAHHDLIFGQLGNDIIQGDGGIESAFAATKHVGASRTPDGCVTGTEAGTSDPTHTGTCDLVGDLDLIASFDLSSTDGQDYIEGGGGNDIVFGGLGQDDVIGGSSDFFSLVTPDHRPDGSDILFGDSGLHSARNDNGGLLPGVVIPGDRHASDADTIVGDNGRIIRIVGINGVDVCDNTPGNGSSGCDTATTKYVSYVYDDVYGTNGQIVVRGVTLLDYTPGGADFRPERFPAGTGICSTSGLQTQDGCSAVLTVNPGRNRWDSGSGSTLWVEIAGNDEIHGGLSDDFIYLGGGNDIAYGDADDDEIIGGWGNDWISGGVGQDAILGDDGRIFASRNSSTGLTAAGVTCGGAGTGTCYSEPLNGITAFRPVGTCSETKSVLCGDFLNQYVATPGEVQTEVINIGGDLKKMVDLTPYNLSPTAGGGDRAKFDANNSDDVIFGGLGGQQQPLYPSVIGHRNNEEPPFGLPRGIYGDFLHGGAGDDAIAGGESIWNGYTQLYSAANGTRLPNAYRTDWTRPFNPGDLLHFGLDHDAWHNNGPIVTRLGEFALYDEYDPRRTVLLNANGSVNKLGTGFMWFLNLYSDEGPTMDGCVNYAPNGTCLATGFRHSDGSDAIFGDEGNDWLVGGTGQDSLYGGWGNDLLNADDVMTIPGTGQFGDQKGRKIQPSPNDTPDTHPLYQDRAFGGAGLDILIGNTGGDRLIDWVGEFNSYIVPFAPFGIATVSRQVPPWLFEFLYAVSASQGADPTRNEDQNALDPELRARNGEPYGELGLITQKDQGLWQDQTGGPSDPQPGNIPGGSRDVLRSADFNDGSLQAFAVDSGAWAVSSGTLSVAASSLGQDAAAVWYHDQYLPVYYEVSARVLVVKPTGGWKGNAYVVFDYFGPDDFKFAGLDDATNKLVMGYRDATGWYTVAQAAIPAGVRYNVWYDMLVAVNGTTVTVLLNGASYFTYAFGPRVIDGVSFGLNKGLLGVGSNNSRGRFDNVQVRILPPNLTLDRNENFSDGVADWLVPEVGTWTVNLQRYDGVATGGTGVSLANLGRQVAYDAYLELDATVRAGTGRLGIVFDYYSATDFKYVMIDVVADLVVLGHRTADGWVIDRSLSFTMTDTIDHTLKLTLKGASVNVVVDGQTLFGHGFNSALVDGGFGTLTTGTGTFDNVRVRTNDSNFDEYNPASAQVSITDASVTEGNSGTAAVTLTISLDGPATEITTVQWVTGPGTALAGTDYVAASGTVTFQVGETTKTITVYVVGDVLVEGNETFYVTLSNSTGGSVIADGIGVVTIVDNDFAAPPTVTVSATGGAEGGSPVVITFTRSGATTNSLTVNAAKGGTSVAGDVGSPVVVGGIWNGSTVTFNAGSSTVTITYSIVDDALVEGTETLTMTLSAGTGYTVGSPSSSTSSIADNDAATQPTVTVAATSGSEGGSPIVITFTRSGSTTSTLAVNATKGGTSVAADVGSPVVSGGTWNGTTVTFNAGSSTVTITYAIVDDALIEGTETLTMTLSAGTGYAVGSPLSSTSSIADNDAAPTLPTLAIGDATVTEGDNGGPTVTVTITVTRSGDTSGTSSVNWTTVAGTALAGSDFTSSFGLVSFAAGQTSKTFTVTIASDNKSEPTETFTVVLSSPTNATIADNTGVVTIIDNDGAIFAASAPVNAAPVAPLNESDARALLAIAILRWIESGASADASIGLSFEIGDLPGTKLADTLGSTIVIDLDAAGWGWSLTPGVVNPGRVDLLSVLLHEIGHVLGHDHTATGIMSGDINPGELLALVNHKSADLVHAAQNALEISAIAVRNVIDVALPVIQPVQYVVPDLARTVAVGVIEMPRAFTVRFNAVTSAAGDLATAPTSGGLPLWPTMAMAMALVMLAITRRRTVTA